MCLPRHIQHTPWLQQYQQSWQSFFFGSSSFDVIQYPTMLVSLIFFVRLFIHLERRHFLSFELLCNFINFVSSLPRIGECLIMKQYMSEDVYLLRALQKHKDFTRLVQKFHSNQFIFTEKTKHKKHKNPSFQKGPQSFMYQKAHSISHMQNTGTYFYFLLKKIEKHLFS